MTKLVIDLSDVAGETHPDDTVVVWSPVHREGSAGRTVSPTRHTIRLTEGKGEREVEPGPLMVQTKVRAIADTRPKEVVVPDQDSVTLWELLEKVFEYTPPVIGQVQQARDEVLLAEYRIESAAIQTGIDREEVSTDRDYVDDQARAIDTAFTASVPPYLQPDSPTGLGANYQTAIVARRNRDTGHVDYSELQSCADRARIEGRTLFAEGLCITDKVLKLNCDADLSDLTINWSGPGPLPEDQTAIKVGGLTGAVSRLTIKFPKIINMNGPTKDGAGVYTWGSDTYGIDIQQAWNCEFHIPLVQDFTYGVRLYSEHESFPTAYNNVYINSVWGCYVGVYVYANRSPGRSGWVNENSFFGGRLSTYSGARTNILISGSVDPAIPGSGRPNMNNFFSTCVEGAGAASAVEIQRGEFNHFHSCRYENGKKLILSAETVGNVFQFGYGLNLLPVENSGTNNIIEHTNALSTQQDALYRGQGKAFDSFKIRPGLGYFYIGAGSAEPTAFIRSIGANGIAIGATSLTPNPGQSVHLGSSADRWSTAHVHSYIHLGGVVMRATSGGDIQVATSTSGPWRTLQAVAP